jgi:hypothetical protein
MGLFGQESPHFGRGCLLCDARLTRLRARPLELLPMAENPVQVG